MEKKLPFWLELRPRRFGVAVLKLYSTSSPVSTGMGDYLRVLPTTQVNEPSHPFVGRYGIVEFNVPLDIV